MTKVINVRNGKTTKSSMIRDCLLVNFNELLYGANGQKGCTEMELNQDEQNLIMGFFQVEMVEHILDVFFENNTKRRGLATNYYLDNMAKLTG